MQKKHIQLLLSMNFCLMAVAAVANYDSRENFVPTPWIKEAPLSWEDEDKPFLPPSKISKTPKMSDAPDDYVYVQNFVPPSLGDAPPEDIDLEYKKNDAVVDTAPDSAFSMDDYLNTQFYHIWQYLEKISKIYPSETLKRFISESKKSPVQYEESNLQKDLAQDIIVQIQQLCNNLEVLSTYEFKEEIDEKSKTILHTQFSEIHDCLDKIRDLYQTKRSLSKKAQLFSNHQLEKLLGFSQDFLKEERLDQEDLYFAKREADSIPESSPKRIELDNQFNQIWSCLDKMNTIHQSELLQSLISHYRDEEISYNENPDDISEKTLKNQFTQIHKALEICSQYQPKEELDEDSKATLSLELDQIKQCLDTIHEIYREESLSKEERVFLRGQLESLYNFSCHFIAENSLQDNDTDLVGFLDKIQMLLNSCEEEDSSLYPQYEYIMNNQETNISDLLINSQAQNNLQSSLLFFNKEEGLIELQHMELLDGEETVDNTDSYTTTWKIRPADVNSVKDWKQDDVINIDKTSIFSKYTMFGESLEYTLTNTNHNKSVRANFVCKSSNQNTYNILSIDYLENIVVLENGPCLFVQSGDLKEWHVKDTVVLQRHGPVTNTSNSHQLINKTRINKEIRVSVKK